MEEEKKKKRNKKKKNKQNKATTDEESDPNHHLTNSQNGDVPRSNAQLDLDSHPPNGALALDNSVKEMVKELPKENESHVQKEALLETIKHLRNENESRIQKEATLEETIKHLRNEIDSHLKKQVSLEETIRKLQNGNGSSLQKEASFQETIQLLQYENESYKQKLATLEVNIVELRSEKEFWLQEKVSLEEKISRLLDEKASLDLKGADLEGKVKQLDKEKESWTLTENSIKETISGLNREIIRLNMQVVELEESRSTLSQENQQLTENVSGLQLYIQNLERNMTSGPSPDEVKQASVHEALNSQIEAATALVDKLIMENAELVEKVNELYVKLEQQSTGAGRLSSTVESVSMAKVAETASLPDSIPSIENGSILAPKLDSVEVALIHDGKVDENLDARPADSLPSFVTEDSGEIVQIPLDDSDVRDDSMDLESQAIDAEENGVPLSDAPIIGAPFRLISFVANYVSGADLVNKN